MKKAVLLLGYARVSKADDQDTAAQVKALRRMVVTLHEIRRLGEQGVVCCT
jgi:hypothetical protein